MLLQTRNMNRIKQNSNVTLYNISRSYSFDYCLPTETIKKDTFKNFTGDVQEKKIELNPADDGDELNTICLKLKTNIKSTTTDALGTKKCKKRDVTKNKTSQFCEEVKSQCEKKKQEYIKDITTRTISKNKCFLEELEKEITE